MKQKPEVWAFEAIGTLWQITSKQPVPQGVRDETSRLIESFDQTFSRFRADSLVTALATGATTVADFGNHGQALFTLYDQLSAATDGAVNPLVGSSLEHLGYDATYTLRAAPGHRAALSWTELERHQGVITAREPFVLDIGAAGKGYLVDLVAQLLRARQIDCVVDAGGDLRNGTDETIRVALEHPTQPGKAIGVAEISPQASLCGSATNRRAWGPGLHHVIDARTGVPTNDVAAAWVAAPTTALADGLSTALFFSTAAELAAGFDTFGSVVVANTGRATVTNFPGEIFR